MALRIVGLDLSMTATGIAYADGSTMTVTTKTDDDLRLTQIRDAVWWAAHPGPVGGPRSPVDLVVIEGWVTRSMSASISGMVHGAVRTALLDAGVPYVVMTPAALKKYATGSGNAGKPEMAVAAFERAGQKFKDDNQCDAWWLRAAGLDALMEPLFPLPKAQRAALASVGWDAPIRRPAREAAI